MAIKTVKDAIKNVAQKNGTDKKLTQRIVEGFLSEVVEILEQGDSLTVKGFGSFSMKTKAGRKGRNIKTGEEIYIPESTKPHFKPSKNFTVYATIHKL